MSDPSLSLQARVEELETRVAFQEQTIQTLSDTLAELGESLRAMEVANRYLAGRLREVVDGGGAGEQSRFEVPPHY